MAKLIRAWHSDQNWGVGVGKGLPVEAGRVSWGRWPWDILALNMACEYQDLVGGGYFLMILPKLYKWILLLE